MRKISLAFALIALLFAVPAHADFTGKDAALATITFKNPGVCTAVVCVPVFQLYDGTNVVTLTTAGADAVSNTLTGQPVYSRGLVFNGTTWDRWQGAVTVAGVATAANQATGNASLATIATNSALPLPAQSNFTTNIGAVTLNDANSNAVLNDPCQTVAKTYTPINVVTATNTIITGVSAKKKYICGIFLYPAGTTNVAIFQATTATACATALVGVIGGTTTATGMVMTAQAGFVLGTGVSSVAATTVNQTDLCIVTSAAVQVSGVVVTVDR